jgi:hypothetical protein
MGKRARGESRLKKNKKFGGQTYKLHTTHASKKAAQDSAKFHRKQGNRARVVKQANPKGHYTGGNPPPKNVYRVYLAGGRKKR